MAIGDVLRLSAVWNSSGDNTEQVNVFHFRQEDALVFDTAEEDLAQSFIDNAVAEYRQCVTSFLSLVNIQVRTLATPATGQDFPQTGLSGLQTATTPLPLQVAAIITWRSGFIGRRYRGRTYLPTATEGNAEGTTWNSTYLTNMTNFADAIFSMASGGIDWSGWQLVVGTDLVTPKPVVTTYTVQPIPGTQRKRRPGVGS